MPLGSVGLSSADPAPPSDLETVYQGGPAFADRLKALSDQTAAWALQREQAEKALGALKLGNDISAAKAAAQSAQDDAKRVIAAAAQTLAVAQAQAERLLADAKAQGAEIVNTALSQASSIKADAEAAKKAANSYAADTKKEADAVLADAKAQLASVTPITVAAQKAKADADAAKTAADTATKAAQDTQKLFQTKIAKLQAAAAD